MWIRTYSSVTCRCKFFKFRYKLSVLIKKFFWMITFKPVLKHIKMFRLIHHDRYLMCPEWAFNLIAIYFLWTCPALWCTKYNHRPLRSFCIIIFSCVFLDCFNLIHYNIKSFCHLSMHFHRITTLNKIWLPAASVKEMLKFFMWNTCKNCRIAYLISIKMKNRKNCTICLRI